MLIMKSGKIQTAEKKEPSRWESIRKLRKNIQQLGNIGSGRYQTSRAEGETIRKECLSKTRKIFETKLCCKILIKGINTWAIPLVRYSGPFLKCTRTGLKQMDRRTRKLLTIHTALHMMT